MSTEKGQRSCLNRCPLDKLTSSEARTNRKDQSAVRTGRIGPCVADIGIDVGNAQSQHPVAGLRAYGPVPVVAALRTGERELGKHTSELQSLMRHSYAVFC